MIDLNDLQTARIRGKIVLTENPNLFSHLDRLVGAVEANFKKKGLRDVRILRADWVVFAGKKWNLWRILNHRNRDLKDFVDVGGIRITMEGSRVVGEYYLKTGRGLLLDMAALAAIIVSIFVALDLMTAASDLAILLGFIGIYNLAERFVRGRWIMKRELPKAIRAAEAIIEAAVIMRDTSGVENEHRDLDPLTLLRTARYYDDQGDPDKARAYLAYLVEKHPHSEEAGIASNELREIGA